MSMSAHAQTLPEAADALKQKIEPARRRSESSGSVMLACLWCCFNEQRFPVTRFDMDQRKVTTLEQGGFYIYRKLPRNPTARERGFRATPQAPRPPSFLLHGAHLEYRPAVQPRVFV